MNLFDSMFQVEWPQQYSLHQFIIFACCTPTHAVLAEIIFTRLGDGYTGNGGGFTHYPPGLSNDSAAWYNTNEWEQWYEWTAELCMFRDNHAKELARWKAQQAAEDAEILQLQQENTRLRDELSALRAETGTLDAGGRSTEELIAERDELLSQVAAIEAREAEADVWRENMLTYLTGLNEQLAQVETELGER